MKMYPFLNSGFCIQLRLFFRTLIKLKKKSVTVFPPNKIPWILHNRVILFSLNWQPACVPVHACTHINSKALYKSICYKMLREWWHLWWQILATTQGQPGSFPLGKQRGESRDCSLFQTKAALSGSRLCSLRCTCVPQSGASANEMLFSHMLKADVILTLKSSEWTSHKF